MPYCAVEGCESSDKDVKLFRFPAKDSWRREQWAKFANYPKQRTPMICAKHFENKHFCGFDSGNNLLSSSNPVPTLFGPKPGDASKVVNKVLSKTDKLLLGSEENCNIEKKKSDTENDCDSPKQTKPAMFVILSENSPVYLPNGEKFNQGCGRNANKDFHPADHDYFNKNPPVFTFTVNSNGKIKGSNSVFKSSPSKPLPALLPVKQNQNSKLVLPIKNSSVKINFSTDTVDEEMQLLDGVSDQNTAVSSENKSFKDHSTQTNDIPTERSPKLFDDDESNEMDVEIDTTKLSDPSLEIKYDSPRLDLFGDLPSSNIFDPDGRNLRKLSPMEKSRRTWELIFLRERLVKFIKVMDKEILLLNQD